MPTDPVDAAVDELYRLDPEQFVQRRGELAAAARQGGDAATAKRITALRRPTAAAWAVNRLVREDADVVTRLADLGRDLRAAQNALDGKQMRALTTARRKLIDELATQAVRLTGQASQREAVAGTFEAALADPDVADALAAGTLVKAASWSGLGTVAPTLRAVPTPQPEPAPQSQPAPQPEPARDRAAEARTALTAADRALRAAEADERKREQKVQALDEQLAAARDALQQAHGVTREARVRQRRAQQALDRLR